MERRGGPGRTRWRTTGSVATMSQVGGERVPGWADRAATLGRKRLALPRYRPPATALVLRAADGTRLHAVHLPGPPDARTSLVLAHGVTNSSRTPTVHAFAHTCATWASVVVVDLRGHGRSGGRSSVGTHEALDVAAAAAAARRVMPDLPVVVVGTSLGGLAALFAVASLPADAGVAGVLTISTPMPGLPVGPAAARLRRVSESSIGRAGLRALLRTRVAAGWTPPTGLADAVAAIAPRWLVVAHDPTEPYFGRAHAEALVASSDGHAEHWWLDGAGHGGAALSPALATRLHHHIESR